MIVVMTILPTTPINDDAVISLSQIAVIDLEASGLGGASFPTEIGRCLLHNGGSISTSGACLIRPAAKWRPSRTPGFPRARG
jgi:hypothetical protein